MSVLFLEFALSACLPPILPVLQSSALTPEQLEGLLQPIVANMLGIPTDPAPWGVNSPQAQSWYAVRIGWQTQGQPAWKITEDVCILRATKDNDEYSRTREQLLEKNGPDGIYQRMSYTQVWTIHFTLYGPNADSRADRIVSSFSLDWAHDALAQNNIYSVTTWNRPQHAPENFQGQWWNRADIDLKFNECVLEYVSIPSAASVDVTLQPNVGASSSFTVKLS